MIGFIKNTKIIKLDFMKNNPEVLVLIIIFFWPLQTTGSLFSTWNGFFIHYFFHMFIVYPKILLQRYFII